MKLKGLNTLLVVVGIVLTLMVLVPVVGVTLLKVNKEWTFNKLSQQASLLPKYPEAKETISTTRTPLFKLIDDAYQTDAVKLTYSFEDNNKPLDTEQIISFYRHYLLSNGWEEIGGDNTQFNFRGHGVRLHIWINLYPGTWLVEFLSK